MGLNILVIGSGGREHSLCWKLAQSDLVDAIYCAPGNAGIDQEDKCKSVGFDALNFEDQLKFCRSNNIDFVVIGPDNALASGIVDFYQNNNIKVFGPTKTMAQLEWSKIYAKEFLQKNNIPTAKYLIGHGLDDSLKKTKANNWVNVFKADGLCLGKGVYVAENSATREISLNDLYDNTLNKNYDSKILLEEKLEGDEMSLFLICDGKKALPLTTCRDYKRRYNNDTGPNTGGMGAYCQHELYNNLENTIDEKIIKPINKLMSCSELPYTGILYVGLMLVKNNGSIIPYVLEFNARFGDPETQVMMPLLDCDLAKLLLMAIDGNLSPDLIKWSMAQSVGVVLASNTYPNLSKAQVIEYTPDNTNNFKIFHANSYFNDHKLYTKGGRIFTCVGTGKTYKTARDTAYQNIKSIKIKDTSYRSDIAGHL